MKIPSLYFHIPFCEKKCFYCSFVVSIGQANRVDSYLHALEREAERCPASEVETIYIGGGTPTFLNRVQFDKFFKFIKRKFSLSVDCEITIEANPEGLDLEKVKFLKDLGATRISLGIQSLQDRYLKYLGRCHDVSTALSAFKALRKAGFDNINLDLMYSFPGQSESDIKKDVESVVSLGSEHLSLYSLTVDPNSRFYAQKLMLDNAGRRGNQYQFITKLLRKNGFRQYEVSNFSKPGCESRHNINYWTGGNYAGFGIGAHSHVDGKRFWNIKKLIQYIDLVNKNQSPVEGDETLNQQQRFMESILIGLRMNAGVDVPALQENFQCLLDKDRQNKIDQFVSQGFFLREDNILKVTDEGRLVLDELSAALI